MGGTSANFQGFPTKHPYVKNPDGSESNVLLGSFGIKGKQYVIPTMVGGIKLTPNDAVLTAKQYGLENYPSFQNQTQADDWAKKYHGLIGADGKLKK